MSEVKTGKAGVASATINPLVSPWVPMKDPKALKVLGKYVEELGECVASTARSIIQGIGESEPVTGKPNKQWLEEEIADVLANADLVMEFFKLDRGFMVARAYKKKEQLKQWHEMLA